MNLVSMKIDAEEMCKPCDPSSYPYGLRIYLNDDQCEALGIKGSITPGTQLTIMARVTVASCTESTEVDGDDTGNDISLDLQITDMGIAAPSSMYPNSMMKE